MFSHNGIWLPDGEKHLLGVGDLNNYQGSKRELALSFVKNWRTAVDVGAHVGLWTMHLIPRFQIVHAFEPSLRNQDCFRKNVGEKAFMYSCALGDDVGRIGLKEFEDSSASTHVVREGDVPLHRLDHFDFPHVDFLKIDCCGWEREVLAGARDTLIRCRPVVSVEQKPRNVAQMGMPLNGAVDLMRDLGAELLAESSGVLVLGWRT